MRLGIVLADGTWPQIVDAVRTADTGGLDTIGFWDHYHSASPTFAPHNGWAVYGFLASVTERIRLCPLVLDGPNYSIGRLAKETSMLSILSGGRFDLGIGIGDIPEEEAAWGQAPYADAAVRIDWLEEVIAALRLAWTGKPVDFSGSHITLRGACCPPGPPSPPPVVIGAGASKRLVRRAASWADEINVYYSPEMVSVAREAIRESGRTLSLSACVDEYDLVGDHLSGTWVDRLQHWQEQGIDRLFVTMYEPFSLLSQLCEAAPHVRTST